ncbi:MAG: protein TolQ [Alphaproteobacteria bacterium]|nr:protein TolQ [Alphaproteobacteria bacterium]
MSDTVSTAVQGVDSTALEGTATAVAHHFSMLGMFLQADWVVKLVMIGLLMASFWCWAIIFEKYTLFRRIKDKAQRFESEFWSSEALDKFYEKTKKRANHPMAVMFVAAMEEWFRSKNSNNAAGSSMLAPQGFRISLKERIVQVMLVARNREIENLERGLGFLATTGSSAPFIGLFGTVWGIMNSFHAIAASKNTSLVAVAPGIAEALFATAIGLFAAIPAVIAYNKFNAEVTRYSNKLDDFSTEFDTILSRQLES